MSNAPGDGFGPRPIDDEDAEALLAGGRTDRHEMASLERFLHEIRAPYPSGRPRPTEELGRLFAEGPAGAFFEAPPATSRSGRPSAARLDTSGPGGAQRKPVRKVAKVAVATTTAALAVTLTAAAQILPGGQPKAPIGVSGPATPVRVGTGQTVTSGAEEVKAAAGATVTGQQPSTSVGRPAAAARQPAAPGVDPLSPEALARLPHDVLRTLSPENLARLPVDVLKTLPGDILARLPRETLNTLPGDVLARLPVDVLKTLSGDTLARLPADVLRTLPTDVLLRLPADVLRLLLSPGPTVTTSSTATAGP